MKRVSVQLPPALHLAVSKEAERLKVSVSECLTFLFSGVATPKKHSGSKPSKS